MVWENAIQTIPFNNYYLFFYMLLVVLDYFVCLYFWKLVCKIS